jgi:hypothetical protein
LRWAIQPSSTLSATESAPRIESLDRRGVRESCVGHQVSVIVSVSESVARAPSYHIAALSQDAAHPWRSNRLLTCCCLRMKEPGDVIILASKFIAADCCGLLLYCFQPVLKKIRSRSRAHKSDDFIPGGKTRSQWSQHAPLAVAVLDSCSPSVTH